MILHGKLITRCRRRPFIKFETKKIVKLFGSNYLSRLMILLKDYFEDQSARDTVDVVHEIFIR